MTNAKKTTTRTPDRFTRLYVLTRMLNSYCPRIASDNALLQGAALQARTALEEARTFAQKGWTKKADAAETFADGKLGFIGAELYHIQRCRMKAERTPICKWEEALLNNATSGEAETAMREDIKARVPGANPGRSTASANPTHDTFRFTFAEGSGRRGVYVLTYHLGPDSATFGYIRPVTSFSVEVR